MKIFNNKKKKFRENSGKKTNKKFSSKRLKRTTFDVFFLREKGLFSYRKHTNYDVSTVYWDLNAKSGREN